MPSATVYLVPSSSSPNTSAVVVSFFLFISRMGVPENPMNIALGNVNFIVESISPNTLL